MADRPRIPGSVSRRAGRWLAQLPPSMGRRGKIHDSEDAAWQWLEQEHAKKTLGLTDDDAPRVTVAELIDVWLAGHHIKASTRIDYRYRIDKHIKAHPIGMLAVGDLCAMHIDRCLNDAPANWTRIHVARILGRFCDWAEGNRFTVGNPYRQSQAKRMCQLVTRSAERRESSDLAWTPEQFIAFIEHERDPVYRDYWIFVAATGARRGEGIGARWSNMHIVDGWCWLADNVIASGSEVIHQDSPKNWKRRKAYFGPIVGKMLLARKDEQEAYKSTSPTWAKEGWVFDRRRGIGPRFFPGTHLAPATITARFNRHAAELCLPRLAGPHGLRRMFDTIAEKQGFTRSARIAAMGHTPNIHDLYPKATEADMRELAARLADLICPNP